MSPRGRVLSGAAVGALGVLLAHPSTRPALLAPFRRPPDGGVARLLQRPALPKPTNAVAGAAYLHAGAERLIGGPPLSTDERRTLRKIAAEGARSEPENAFWPLARCVFEKDGESRQQWKDRESRLWALASGCRLYDDHQNAALEDDRLRLAAAVGGDPAWTYAAVAPRRSDAMVRCVVGAAVDALAMYLPQGQRDVLACETIQNGAMLRDGSRSLRLGRYGITMIEGATYPPEMVAEASPRRLWSAKTALTGRLRVRNPEAATYCDLQFRINDGWQAFGAVQDPEARFQAMRLGAVIVGTLPGGLLVAAATGGLVALFARSVAQYAEAHSRFKGPGLALAGSALLVAGSALGYPLVGIAAAACALVPMLGPEHPRADDGSSLGPFHAFVVGGLAVALLVLATLTGIAVSLPAGILAGKDNLGAWLADAPRLGAFVVVLLGASALVAPAWAVVRRHATPTIAARTYRVLGRGTAFLGLGLAILLSPLCLAADRWLGVDLRRIEQNEQIYYNPSVAGGP